MAMTNIDWVAVGDRIRRIRKENGLSQREFGRRFGVSQNMVSLYEKGKSRASVDFYIRVAKFGGKSIEWLLTGRSDNTIETLREMRSLHEEMNKHLSMVRRLIDCEAQNASQRALSAIEDPNELREALLSETDLPSCIRELLQDGEKWREFAMNGREICILTQIARTFGEISTGDLRLLLGILRKHQEKREIPSAPLTEILQPESRPGQDQSAAGRAG